MSACDIDVVVAWVTRVDHQAVDELHGLGSLTSELAGDNDLAALSARLHDESEDTVAGPSDSQTTDELVSERLGLSDGAETTDSDLLSVELDGALGEVESLLNDSSQFADSASLLSQNVLGPGGHDDDLCPGRGDSDLNT